MSTTVTSKGQVTIPKPVRDRLNIKPGSQVDFQLAEDGRVVLVKAGKKLAAPAKGPVRSSARYHEKRHDDGRDHGADARRPRRGMIFVDTNVLLDVVTDDPLWADWSQQQLDAATLRDRLAINPWSMPSSPAVSHGLKISMPCWPLRISPSPR